MINQEKQKPGQERNDYLNTAGETDNDHFILYCNQPNQNNYNQLQLIKYGILIISHKYSLYKKFKPSIKAKSSNTH